MTCDHEGAGRGLIANMLLERGTRFVDPCVKYKANEVPFNRADTDFYIKVVGGGCYQLASEGLDGEDDAFKSHTYFLNEARKSNLHPDSRVANIAFSEWRGLNGISVDRRFELLVLRDINPGNELVVAYTHELGDTGRCGV